MLLWIWRILLAQRPHTGGARARIIARPGQAACAGWGGADNLVWPAKYPFCPRDMYDVKMRLGNNLRPVSASAISVRKAQIRRLPLGCVPKASSRPTIQNKGYSNGSFHIVDVCSAAQTCLTDSERLPGRSSCPKPGVCTYCDSCDNLHTFFISRGVCCASPLRLMSRAA